MDIPAKYIFHGDRQKCEALYGQARRVLHILDTMMATGGLQQRAIKFVPYPGALIIARKVFGTRVVEIYTGGALVAPRTKQTRECFCFPHFSFGVVQSVNPSEPVQGVDPNTGQPMEETPDQFAARLTTYQTLLPTVRFQYDVAVCAVKQFILCPDVLDANFGRYNVGQFVLVTMAGEMEEWEYPLDCGRPCLMSNPRFETFMISPLHILPKMKQWKNGPKQEVVG